MSRFVKVKDRVWWSEIVAWKDDTPIYETFSGYYLASYMLGEKLYNIVSLNSITSCVVRHLTPSEMFYSEEKAIKKLKELNGEV